MNLSTSRLCPKRRSAASDRDERVILGLARERPVRRSVQGLDHQGDGSDIVAVIAVIPVMPGVGARMK
jgi:hypothetical protein